MEDLVSEISESQEIIDDIKQAIMPRPQGTSPDVHDKAVALRRDYPCQGRNMVSSLCKKASLP